MAALREGGNEYPGSLKAISNWDPGGKKTFGEARRRGEDNIKMDLREVGYDDRDWINLAQDRDQCRTYVRVRFLKSHLSRKQGLPKIGMRTNQFDKEERRQEKSRDNLNDIELYRRKRNDIDRISLAL
ncbi:hypothetical protein ANN_21189 [Periplaneta americana]|uniref:Uncharacterized protein n=1 Tax=Periplaneta americana TaxID=6978 RepID=A0ABQ8SEN0_PERAM|nr:hypothetical protein ANN_21189 [Periplaneta americana]